LGRDLRLIDEWSDILGMLAKKQTVCDADFFWFFTQDIFNNLKIMRSGKCWVFTPNKREFIKIFSSLNKKSFDFRMIDHFMANLEIVLEKMKNEKYVNEIINYDCGGDGTGDGVFSSENLSEMKKSFLQLVDKNKDYTKGKLGNDTIKIHPIGKLVKVNIN
jgi:hypothetical protein